MKYTVKAGAKEFFFVLVWIGVIALAGDLARYLVPEPPVLKQIVTILLGCVLVYFVYTRYCAEFTYTLGEEGITAKSRIGRRERTAYAEYNTITSVSAEKPEKKPELCDMFVKSIIHSKKRRYISYNNGGRMLVIEADGDFMQKLKEKING